MSSALVSEGFDLGDCCGDIQPVVVRCVALLSEWSLSSSMRDAETAVTLRSEEFYGILRDCWKSEYLMIDSSALF